MKSSSRCCRLCAGQITPESISKLSVEEIKAIGTSTAKANYIKSAASAVLTGELDFTKFPDMTDEAALKELVSLRGIGTWTAKMYLIFVLDRQDILPFEDVAFLQSYKLSRKSIEKKCKKWKPYSSIAARFLYRALDMGFTKEEFHLYL